MEKKYNLRSPSVKRLMKEAKELHEPTELYYAQPLEDNLFEWHFTIRGPPDSDFAGGRYHGRITLPPEYPMKPPSIMISTPNGRFEIGKKICLSMSAHHPETWQPSWSIRTVLMALIGFMPTQGAGAIGSLDYTPQERKSLAKKSRDWECPACGISASSALKDGTDDSASAKEAEREAAELASQIVFKGESEKEKKENENISSETSHLPSDASSAEITLNSQSENANSVPATLGIGSSGVTDQIPQVPQGYQAWPYSFYPYGHPMYMPPGFGPQDNVVQATGFNPGAQTITCYPSTQTQPTMSTVGSNINDATNIESTVRQRLTHQLQDQGVSPQIRNQDSNMGVQPQAFAPPYTSQRGMASLLIIWILLAAITALVIRRIFILS